MSRTHDVTISAFDLDRLEAELAAVTEQRDRLAEEIEKLKEGLEREQDELKKQLLDAKSSTAFWMGKYNNADFQHL